MGRELQKKKNRSSIAKVRQKPKSKKLNLRANPIIAANWDRTLSVAQNYKNLGLTSRLNHRTGGIEKHQDLYNGEEVDDDKDVFAIGSKKPAKLETEEATVTRDPKTGAILSVVSSGKQKKPNPLNDPLNELEDLYEEEVAVRENKPRKGVIKELEELAARGEEKRPRKQSEREQEWISALVEKYGDDYRAMSRDRKLNPMQQSEGDIKKRARKWVENQQAAS